MRTVKKKHVSSNPILYRPRFYDNLPIEGCYGYYVSPRGRIYTRRRLASGRKSQGGFGEDNTLGYWRELTLVLNNKGYKRVVIQQNLKGRKRRLYIQLSRLVALAWIPNPENKPFVCHKDNNPLNNRISNLYWGTQSENIKQMVKDKRGRWDKYEN